MIARTVATLAEYAGARPVGWHTKSASSVDTRRLLMEAGGRMMSVGLHPHMSVRPGRIAGLEQVLDHVARAGGEA